MNKIIIQQNFHPSRYLYKLSKDCQLLLPFTARLTKQHKMREEKLQKNTFDNETELLHMIVAEVPVKSTKSNF